MHFSFTGLLRDLGPMRVALALFAILLIIFATKPGTDVSYEGMGLVTSVLIPTFAPLVFFVLLLDALMTRVWMVDAQGEEHARLRRVLWTDLGLALGLVLIWMPFFYALAT